MDVLDNHNTHPVDGHAKLYICARPNGRISLLLNVSHALLDFFASCVVWQTMVDEIAKPDTEEGEVIEWGEEVGRLPRSIGNVISEAYPQGWWAWAKSIITTLKGMGNVRKVRWILAFGSLVSIIHTSFFGCWNRDRSDHLFIPTSSLDHWELQPLPMSSQLKRQRVSSRNVKRQRRLLRMRILRSWRWQCRTCTVCVFFANQLFLFFIVCTYVISK